MKRIGSLALLLASLAGCGVAPESGGGGAASEAPADAPGTLASPATASAAPVLFSCKSRSAGAACSVRVGRLSYDGLCVSFPAEPFAGALVCVPPPPTCTPTCGQSGQACCAPGNTCQGSLTCQAGTCATAPGTCTAGTLCSGTCTDLSAGLAAAITAALPGSFCLPQGSTSTTSTGTGASWCNAAACSGRTGCAVPLTYGPVSVDTVHGLVSVEANVNATIDFRETVAGGTIGSCSVTVSGPLLVTVPVTAVTGTGSESLTVSGSPSVDASRLAYQGCGSDTAIIQLLPQVIDSLTGQLVIQALIPALGGASATCP